jgi:hypothetical protein
MHLVNKERNPCLAITNKFVVDGSNVELIVDTNILVYHLLCCLHEIRSFAIPIDATSSDIGDRILLSNLCDDTPRVGFDERPLRVNGMEAEYYGIHGGEVLDILKVLRAIFNDLI